MKNSQDRCLNDHSRQKESPLKFPCPAAVALPGWHTCPLKSLASEHRRVQWVSRGEIKDVTIFYSAAARRDYRKCALLETNRTVNQKGNPTSNEQSQGLVHRQGSGRALVKLESRLIKQSQQKRPQRVSREV